jgi:ceramide glucosyltransferase
MVPFLVVNRAPGVHCCVSESFIAPNACLIATFCRRRRYRSRPGSLNSSSRNGHAPGVSILRPLKGLDTNLYENLESTFKQDYPNYEIIFSVADENDQALHVVNALVVRYPQINVTTIIGIFFSLFEEDNF